MNFRDEFLAALRSGQPYDVLMELVRRHRCQGLSVDAAYEVLQAIWLEHGFDGEREGGALQDNLEAVMEKVWFGFPAEAGRAGSAPASER